MRNWLKGILAALVAFAMALAGASVVRAEDATYIAFGRGENPTMLYVQPGDSYKKEALPPSIAQLVYCFNMKKSFPPRVGDNNTINSVSDPLFSRTFDRETASLSSFAASARDEDIDGAVLGVMYNGFDGAGSDRAGIQQKLGLTDEEFYQATERAIWYFTDSNDDFVGLDRLKGQTQRKQRLEALAKPENKVRLATLILTGRDDQIVAVNSAYEPVDLKDVPENATLEVFKPEDTNYQNLLGAKFVNKDDGTPVEEETEEPTPAPSSTETTPTSEEPTNTQTTPKGSSGNGTLDRCVTNAVKSPLLWLLPIGVLARIGGPVVQPYLSTFQSQLDQLNAELAGKFQISHDRDPFGELGRGFEHDNSQWGEFQARIDAANRELQQLADSPEVQHTGQVLGTLAGVVVAGLAIYKWCTTEPVATATAKLSS